MACASGILHLDELVRVPLVDRHWRAVGEQYPGIAPDKRQRALVRDMIGTMVGDVLNESRRRIAGSGAQSIDDVRAAGRALVGFSEALAGEERELKRFLYAKLYGSRQLEEGPPRSAAGHLEPGERLPLRRRSAS